MVRARGPTFHWRRFRRRRGVCGRSPHPARTSRLLGGAGNGSATAADRAAPFDTIASTSKPAAILERSIDKSAFERLELRLPQTPAASTRVSVHIRKTPASCAPAVQTMARESRKRERRRLHRRRCSTAAHSALPYAPGGFRRRRRSVGDLLTRAAAARSRSADRPAARVAVRGPQARSMRPQAVAPDRRSIDARADCFTPSPISRGRPDHLAGAVRRPAHPSAVCAESNFTSPATAPC